jgi:isocitrate/isopropylmalate dehydrogenase
MFPAPTGEFVVAGDGVHPHGVDRILEIRLRARASPAEAAPDLGHQVERHLHHHALLGRARGGDGRHYPGVRWDKYHIDILTAHFVLHPDWFDVVVGSNLFGDILSDLGPACTGTIGIAPSGNINPERDFPSVFEPVHGSAPDIAGQGVANPIGQIWSGAMMLEHLGQPEAAAAIIAAIEKATSDPATRTRDLGGRASTEACGKAIAAAIG